MWYRRSRCRFFNSGNDNNAAVSELIYRQERMKIFGRSSTFLPAPFRMAIIISLRRPP
jgi:hypothetical protein